MLHLALVLAAVQTDTAALGPRLSLQTVVARTLAYSPAIASAHGAVRDASAARRVALGAYLPSLSLSSSAAWNDPSSRASLSSTSPTNTYGAGVAASLDLFTGGRRGAQRSAADAEARAADAGWVFERYATILMAKQGYFAMLRSRELVRVAQEFVAAAELGLTYAMDRAATGTATRSDVLRARIAVAAARRQWLAAEDTLAMAGAMLGRLVGADGPVDVEPLASLDPTPLALSDSALRALAPAVAPLVVAADAQAVAGAALVRSSRSQYFPTISAGTGYNWANAVSTSAATRAGWVFAITTSFPLFNGFVREASVTHAEAAADVARVASADTRRFIRADVQRLLGTLHVAEQDIALTGESVRLAREDLRVIQARYRSGIATILDVLTSQTAFVQSELDLVSAQFTYQVARASLEVLLGRDL